MKLLDEHRDKIDLSDDEIFYQQPRYCHHLSASFRKRLTNLYSEYLCEHHIVLDLMSSWVSHLPTHIKFKKIIGHGLNEAELNSNKRLDSFWVQNFNKIQNIPIDNQFKLRETNINSPSLSEQVK